MQNTDVNTMGPMVWCVWCIWICPAVAKIKPRVLVCVWNNIVGSSVWNYSCLALLFYLHYCMGTAHVWK